jgi:hypothetical protein
MSLNVDRLATAQSIYPGASRDSAHRPADDHHGGSIISSQNVASKATDDDINLENLSVSDPSTKKKKKLKATFDWKEGSEDYIGNCIRLLDSGKKEKINERHFKISTGATLNDFYRDIEFLRKATNNPLSDASNSHVSEEVKTSAKKPKASFNWKEGSEKFVKKAIRLIKEEEEEIFIEKYLKEKTGASLNDLYKDKDFLCWALGVEIPNSNLLL